MSKSEIRDMVIKALEAGGSSDLETAREQYFALGGHESEIGPRDSVDWYRRRALLRALGFLYTATKE